MTKIRLFISLLLLSICLSGISAQFVCSGKVVDAVSKATIAGVTIFDNTSGSLVDSDEFGLFNFQSLEAGTHIFTIIAIGYSTENLSVKIDGDTKQDIYLEKLAISLTAIEIADKRQELFALKQLEDFKGTSIYAGKKTEVIVLDLIQANLASNKGRQVYAQIAGLNIYEGSDGGLQLAIGGRGLDPNRTSNFNTRQNNYDISADVLGYPENYYTPPSEALDQIQIIRGASSLQYGTQFGGLINFKLKEIPSFKSMELESNQTIGSFGFFNSFNRLGINKKKLSVNAFYNYKQGNGYRENAEFNANNAFAQISYDLTPNTTISAEMTYFGYLAKQAGGLTDNQFAETPRLSTRSRNWFQVDWKLYNIKLESQLSASSTFSLSLFGLDAARNSLGYRGNPLKLNENPITALDEQRADGTFVNPRDLIKGRFRNVGLEAKYLFEYKLFAKRSIALIGTKLYSSRNTSFQGAGSAGIDANFEDKTLDFPDYANQSDFVFPNQNASVFAEQIIYINDKFSITPGIRFEYINTKAEGDYKRLVFDNAENLLFSEILQDTMQLPRFFALGGIGINYKWKKQYSVYANISQNYRSVTFSDIRVVNPTFIVDPEIRDESGFTADAGIRGRYKKQIAFDLGIYNIYYNDRIGVIIDERANRVRKNIGSAIISGVESLVDVNLKEILYPSKKQLNLSVFANTALTFSQYLSSEENNVVGKQVEFIPLVNLKTGLKLGYKNFISSLQYTYVSSQFTDVENSSAAFTGDNRSGIIGEIPSYQIVDLAMSYKWKNFKFSTGINNLLNQNYYTRRATGYPGPGIIPSEGRSFYATVAFKL
ncbi:TonB-dependent receptor [Saprospiraceae bacterium]|nr:TonB-dependent receptor [Saprospiraceae bacterium]